VYPPDAPGEKTPLFEFDGVSLDADSDRILDSIDLRIGPGFTAVVGPSGSGKSSLLRLLNRLDAPTEGAVRFGGADLADLDPLELRRQVAMVFQRPLIFPGTVHANLAVAHPDLSEQAAADALGRVGLPTGILDQDASTLSGGEAQRLALARVLLNQPKVLLADEVTSALDGESGAVIEGLFRQLTSEGTTVVAVTHSPAQARALADQVIVLVEGSVRAAGTLTDLDGSTDPAVRTAIGADA
jgi:putative ABC transport system ATP-binding protein